MRSSFLKPDTASEPDSVNVYLYAQPFPQEAERLRFTVEEIFARRDDGAMIPLSVSLHEFERNGMKRQRLIASGDLPPGRYAGFSVRVGEASLEIEEGRADLLVPDQPVEMDFFFEVSTGESSVISLRFRYAESIKQGVMFTPSFAAAIPRKPVITLSGYVANYNDNNIMVFDKGTKEITGVIATGRGPSGIALDQKSRKAYVTLEGDDSVEVIDIIGGKIINRIQLSTGDRPREPAISPDGKILLTANPGSDTVSMIDPVSFYEFDRIQVDKGPASVLIDRGGRRAYVFNSLSNTISIIDLVRKSIAAVISTDPGPLRGQFNRQGDKLYVIHRYSSYVTVIDPFSLSVQQKINVGMGMASVKLDTRTDLVYLGREHGNAVDIYSPLNFVPIDTIKTVGGVSYMAIDDEENNLYLLIPEDKTLSVISIVSHDTLSRIDVGKGSNWITIMGER